MDPTLLSRIDEALGHRSSLLRRIDIALEEDNLDEKGGWRKAVATGLAGLGMMAAPMTGKASGSEQQWDTALNRAWHQLPAKQRQELRQDEREWVHWKEKLPDEVRYRALQDRAGYLYSITQGASPTAALKSEIADKMQLIKNAWAKLRPEQQE
jgi:hypothetical protein